MHTMKKTKTQVTRICPSILCNTLPALLDLLVFVQSFSSTATISGTAVNTFKSPGPFSLHCTHLAKPQLWAAACLWGKSAGCSPSSHKPVCASVLHFQALPDRAAPVLFPFFTPFHPPLPRHSQLTDTPHMSLRNQNPLCDLSLIFSPSNLSLHAPSLVSTEKVCLPSHSLIPPLGPCIPFLWLSNVLALFVSPSACISNFFLSAGSFSSA